ncbi:major facilitator superfamily domain-containing protein [Exophiala viscosa]|uniref:major facilitator superfamily domain-containing protein n=1 Tax=Exophiala viscosa TaxID=2486360 RepID=UPI00219D07EC|nr:major facilitator superfamily domain-containing protein [Exophiala viscosa]
MFGLTAFAETKASVEAEGIYIGGYSIRRALWPKTVDGKHVSSQDRVEHVAAIQDWNAAEEAALVRKLDCRVLLPCCIIYFLAYLDRANMGFVNIMHAGTKDSFEENLHLKGTDFNWSVSITYFMVTVLLMPSNLLMKRFGAKKYFPVIMVLWGTIVMTISAVKNIQGLLTARFFLGIPEAGVVPTSIMYFSFWYKPTERALRIGIFHAANALASGVGGFLAVGIDKLDGRAGLESWRWLFIIEGLLPIVMAIPVHFLLLTFPETSPALTDRERHIAINRFGRGSTRSTDVTWEWRTFFAVLKRPSTYVFFVSYICLLIVAVALGTFLPTILKVFAKFSSTKANEYSSAVYFAAIVVYAFGPGIPTGPETESGIT